MKQNKGHFKNLVLIARADGVVSPEEEAFLNMIARNIGLTDEQVADIMADPDMYPMEPPVSKEDRIERLVALVEMVVADNEIDALEVSSLSRVSAGLGFNDAESARIVNYTLSALNEGQSRGDIVDNLMD
jgi:uncharacterized tellurite resistance protein B-like protein